MGGVVSSIGGALGLGGGGGGGSQTVVQSTDLPDYLEGPIRENIAEAQRIAGRPYQAYSGSTVAGLASPQQQAINLAQSGVNVGQPQLAAAQQATQQAMGQYGNIADVQAAGYQAPTAVQAQNFLTGDVAAYMNPFTQNVIDQSLRDLASASQYGIQQIGQQARQAGAFGGSRQGVAEALQRSQDVETAGRISADLRSQAFQDAAARMAADQARQQQVDISNRDAQMRALSESAGFQQAANLANQQAAFNRLQGQEQAAAQLAQLGQMGFDLNQANVGQLLSTGAVEQAQRQAELDDAYARFLERRNYPIDMLNLRIGATSSVPVAGTTTQRGGGSGGSSFLSTLGGIGSAAAGLAQLGSMFGFSDENMKTDIKKVGKDEETGLDLYAYRYKGDPKTYPKVVGPMAQDIEKKFPDQVVDVGKYKAVNLGFGPMQRAFS
jgi:hypothetical protein